MLRQAPRLFYLHIGLQNARGPVRAGQKNGIAKGTERLQLDDNSSAQHRKLSVL